jgi:plasmid stabilization system protein ParE
MRYTVVWVPSAEDDLAKIWMEATNRSAVASAADTIDGLLREDPHRQGESHYDGVRTLSVSPLGIDFEVRGEDRLVKVLAVWKAHSQ